MAPQRPPFQSFWLAATSAALARWFVPWNVSGAAIHHWARPGLGVTECAEARTSLPCLGCAGDARR